MFGYIISSSNPWESQPKSLGVSMTLKANPNFQSPQLWWLVVDNLMTESEANFSIYCVSECESVLVSLWWNLSQKTASLQSPRESGLSALIGHCPLALWFTRLNWPQLNNAQWLPLSSIQEGILSFCDCRWVCKWVKRGGIRQSEDG